MRCRFFCGSAAEVALLASYTEAWENTRCCSSAKWIFNVPQEHVATAGNEKKIDRYWQGLYGQNAFPSCSGKEKPDDEDFLNKISVFKYSASDLLMKWMR